MRTCCLNVKILLKFALHFAVEGGGVAPSNRQLGYIQFISWSPRIAWYLSVAYFPVVNCNYSTVQKPWTARFLCTVWALRRYVIRFKWPSCCQTSLLWSPVDTTVNDCASWTQTINHGFLFISIPFTHSLSKMSVA